MLQAFGIVSLKIILKLIPPNKGEILFIILFSITPNSDIVQTFFI